ncbi:hypothetical protein BDD16_002162 [Sphaerotilus montanus]|uniref:Uncharacterized protein n=1 Tax=Sphaerotilus montanus TaxID=522889 RepID=A0A7Y9U765_9BURK|nr:hypothetical protein [Sphaerotilus montanus]
MLQTMKDGETDSFARAIPLTLANAGGGHENAGCARCGYPSGEISLNIAAGLGDDEGCLGLYREMPALSA